MPGLREDVWTGYWETRRLWRKKRGGVSERTVPPGKGSGGGTGKPVQGCGRGEKAERPLRSSNLRKNEQGDETGPGQRGAPRYLQRSSRTLPGISTRLVSMMRTHSRSSASRLRAPGTESTARRLRLAGERAAAAAALTSRRGGRGETCSLPSYTLSLGPPRLGRGMGRSPGSYAPVLLERPNGKLGSREPGRVSQWDVCLLVRRLQAPQLLLRKPTSRRLWLCLEGDMRMCIMLSLHNQEV